MKLHQPCTVCVSVSENKLARLPRHTVLGIAFRLPAHNMTVGSTASEESKVKEQEENGNGGTADMDNAET